MATKVEFNGWRYKHIEVPEAEYEDQDDVQRRGDRDTSVRSKRSTSSMQSPSSMSQSQRELSPGSGSIRGEDFFNSQTKSMNNSLRKSRNAWMPSEHTVIEPFNPLFNNDDSPEITPQASPSPRLPNNLKPAEPSQRPSPIDERPMQLNLPEASTAWEKEMKQLLAAGLATDCLALPAPSDGFARCIIQVAKSKFGTTSSLSMFIEKGGAFLMSAATRTKSRGTTFVISMDEERSDAVSLSKLKCPFADSTWMLWKQSHSGDIHHGYGQEQLCMSFDPVSNGGSLLCIKAALVMPNSEWTPDGPDALKRTLASAGIKELSPDGERGLAMLTTKKPRWDKREGHYSLEFVDRKVRSASTKNIQIVAWDFEQGKAGTTVMLQLAKLGNDKFALDFGFPFCAETAFAVALATMTTSMGVKIGSRRPQIFKPTM